jgi:hypothetical protein
MNLPTQKRHTHIGRVQSLFGIYIPPKKVFKADKYLTLRFAIRGIIPSKKNDFHSENNVRPVIKSAVKLHGHSPQAMQYIKENTKSWIRGSKRYLDWVEQITPDVRGQMDFWRGKYGLVFPLDFVSIKTYYFFADEMARDLHNKDEAVYDMLVKLGVIADDNYGVLYKTSSDGACYKGEIYEHITTVDVTLALFTGEETLGSSTTPE